MHSGCFGKFGKVARLRSKLDFQEDFVHKQSGEQLVRAVQLNEAGHFRDDLTLEGIVIDQTIAEVPNVLKKEGRWQIVIEHKPVTLFNKFLIVGNGFVVLSNSRLQDSTFRILSRAMAGRDDFVEYIGFDLQRIFNDFHSHWLTGISGRKGNWNSGTLYGDNLEQDDVVGRPLARSRKRIVGFSTTYFSSDLMKVGVTANGSVTVWGGITRDQFLEFVMDELAQYMTP